MAFNDPIAELLTKVRNAKNAKHRYVDISLSRVKLNIIKILKESGFVSEYLLDEKKGKIRVFLKYAKGRVSVINDLKRESRPGYRKYLGYQDIPVILGGLGIGIISTSKGILGDKEAREMKVGGEFLCSVW